MHACGVEGALVASRVPLFGLDPDEVVMDKFKWVDERHPHLCEVVWFHRCDGAQRTRLQVVRLISELIATGEVIDSGWHFGWVRLTKTEMLVQIHFEGSGKAPRYRNNVHFVKAEI